MAKGKWSAKVQYLIQDADVGLSNLSDDSLLAQLLTKDGDVVDYISATDSLEALSDAISAISTASPALASVLGALDDAAASGAVTAADTAMQYLKQIVTALINVEDDTGTAGVVLGTKATEFGKLAGENQIAITTEDLNQAVGSYDLFLGTTKPCLLKSFSIKQPTTVTAGALTSISIQTDDATPGTIISSTDGAVGNLLTESELSWTGVMRIETGTKIQLTIAGGATGVGQICDIVAEYAAIEDTGYLAP